MAGSTKYKQRSVKRIEVLKYIPQKRSVCKYNDWESKEKIKMCEKELID